MRIKIWIFGLALVCTAAPGIWSAPSGIVWTDDTANNPVIASPGFGDNRAYYTNVLFDSTANKWRAWYDASSGFDIGYAESVDAAGTSWTNYQPCTGFSTDRQSKGFILQTGPAQFRMWYMANERAGGYQVNTCTSSDGISWTNDVPIEGVGLPDITQMGPTERIVVEQLDNGTFVAYARVEEPDQDFEGWMPGMKMLYRYTSTNGIDWTLTNSVGVSEVEGLEGIEFSSVVKHPDQANVWYAWGNPANGERPISSFVSTDDGMTFELDEDIVATVGDTETASYNQNRNYHASVTYLGNGQWVMFRTVAEPKTTARATGMEATAVQDWELR